MNDLAPDLRTRFVTGMSYAACTVNVITTGGKAGRAGVTVSAMSSVSADGEGPTLLVCVHHKSLAAEKIAANGTFCVNVLRDDQSYVSDTFAGRFKDEIQDKFDCTTWEDCAGGAPRMADALVAFDCKLQSSQQIGTHHIFIGEVQDIHATRAGSPLIYANRAYGASSQIEGTSTLKLAAETSTAKVTVGCFQTFGPFMIPQLLNDAADLNVKLIEGDHRRIRESLASGESEVALLYDMALGEGLTTELLTSLEPYVLLPEGHALAEQREVSPEDLADEPLILLDVDPSRDYFTGLMTDAGVIPKVAHRTSSLEMVRAMVGHGMGYALLATKPASPMSYDGKALVTRPLAGAPKASGIVLAHRTGRRLSPAAERFAEICRTRLKG
ncbi:LysR substrate-binding domain-containing protein [Roseovarius sp. Pro17]|uniref:LysR substrate-binding domain-containing protein n=1 Tax=Roseovarius sp. Pro17 TaxID=3108175 RepID=UPI002D78288A|nr:LysR substrate-binding domain-containing protein [Roseovarius sp. Pro17]